MNEEILYSVIVPVYNSENTVGQVIDRIFSFFLSRESVGFEIILVNDASRDRSWEILTRRAVNDTRIVAVNLMRNYGQHTALYCGLKYSRGAYVITLDDDLQNPPEEMSHLIEKVAEGHDVVFGRFKQKQHSWMRRLGSLLIRQINQRIFHCPPGLFPTNFRIIRREVVERILQYQVVYPYITGLSLMFSANPANVWVEHRERAEGESNYTLYRILGLVARILFNYSVWPLRFVSMSGLLISLLSFLAGLVVLYAKIFGGINVQGWASIMVMMSLFNGVTILMLGMLGEYTVRILQQVSSKQVFHVKDVISNHG